MLRDGGSRNLREYLISTAARLIAERGTAGLAVRDITRAAQVADGVLYNYFEDKEDLLAQALMVHVGSVMGNVPGMPEPGTGTLAGNLRLFVVNGVEVLVRVAPAFAGLVTQPNVLTRFRAMIGGDAAFGVATGEERARESSGPQGLPDMLTGYLRAEQRLGRVGATVDVVAAARLIVGAIHGQVLPTVMFNPGAAVTTPPDFAERLVATVLHGIARE